MFTNPTFAISLLSLLIIVIYAILVFKNVDPLVATIIGVILGFAFNHTSPIVMGNYMESALSSFLALVGFIIMLGRGLGEVLNESKISHTIVYKIVYTIGINTKRRVKIGVIFSSIIIVGALGTLAGGLAILAPILRPIAAKVGLSKPSLAALMQASGEEALILGPFTPPVVTLLGVTNLSYLHMLFYIAIPVSIVTLTTSWIMANVLQKRYSNEIPELTNDLEDFKPNARQNGATIIFIIGFFSAVVYGLSFHAKTSFVIIVMLFLAFISGFAARLSFKRIVELLISGMQKNLYLFFIFVLLDPFLNLIEKAGGFNSLSQLFKPLEQIGGKPIVAILIGITGAFGMPAAAVAVIKMLHELFLPTVTAVGLPITAFAFSMLIATRITNFAYPGANMFSAMALAESDNVKAMIRHGLTITAVQTTFLILYSFTLA